jgi:hypothetical protein
MEAVEKRCTGTLFSLDQKSEYPEESHTHFVVVFHDKSWDSLDWFNSI